MSSRFVRSLVACAATAMLCLTTSLPELGAADGKADGTVAMDTAISHWKKHRGPDRQRVIIRVVPGKRALVRRALRRDGLAVKAEHPLIDALTLEVPRKALHGLSHNPNILSISLDAPTGAHQTAAPSGQTLRSTVGVASVAARGAGVGIAVIDSGIAPSTSVFGNRITAFYDFTTGTPRATAPFDPYGHGTHVAGLAAGGPFWAAYPGIASSANLVGLRVLDDRGQGYTSNVIAAIEFAVSYRAQLGIDLINLSLGHPILEPAATDPLVQAVEAAARAGVVVVVSAGLLGWLGVWGLVGYAGITSPGNAPSAIAVGALDTNGTVSRGDDTVAAFSSRGPTWYDGEAKPDIVAPGSLLTAAVDPSCRLYQENPGARVSVALDANRYLRLSGTSMAAAVVSGVVATMIEAHRDLITWNTRPLSPNTVKAILQVTALPAKDNFIAVNGPAELSQGAGAVNAIGAARVAQMIDAARPLGLNWTLSAPWPATTVGGDTIAWGQHLVWGSHLVWGNALYVHEKGWDEASTWGSLGAEHIVWGNIDPQHLVWGNLTWGSHIVWGNALVGTLDGQHIVWGNVVDAEHLVWGNLSAQHLVWGNSLAIAPDAEGSR
jgi:serine protease AprX